MGGVIPIWRCGHLQLYLSSQVRGGIHYRGREAKLVDPEQVVGITFVESPPLVRRLRES